MLCEEIFQKGPGGPKRVPKSQNIGSKLERPALQFAENSAFDFVLKGRGFKPRRKCPKISPASAAEAALKLHEPFFSKMSKPRSGARMQPTPCPELVEAAQAVGRVKTPDKPRRRERHISRTALALLIFLPAAFPSSRAIM